MPYAPAAGARIYYELHGPKPGAAPAIVFAHGAGGCHLSWWQQVPHFMAEYRCLTFDHRGFGMSTVADGEPTGASFADDLRALLDHTGIVRATLVAQSMGGWTGLSFATRWPDRVERLMLCDTFGGLAAPGIDGVWSAAGALIRKLPPGVHPAAGERMVREQPLLHFLYTEIAALSPPYTPAQLRAILTGAGATTLEQAAALDMPVFVLAGAEDIVFPPEYLRIAADALPRAQFSVVPAAGHSVYFERSAAFNGLLERFLTES